MHKKVKKAKNKTTNLAVTKRPLGGYRAIPTTELILREYLFVKAIVEITHGLYVYKTDKGPILAICGNSETVSFFRAHRGQSFIKFRVSSDLRVSAPSADFMAKVSEALLASSPVMPVKHWYDSIMKAVSLLSK